MTNLLRRLPLLAGVLVLAGCGGEPTGTVAGLVTLDGKPVEAGTVTFMVGGVSYSGPIAAGGRYAAGPMPVGEATVLVFDPPDEATQVQLDKAQLEKLRQSKQPMPQPKAKPPVVPPHYSDAARSPLKTTVTSGSDNTFNVEMKR